jgi:hypothetical protein
VGILGLSASVVLLGFWIHMYSPQNRRFGWLCLIRLVMAALLAAWLGNVVDRLWDVFQGPSTNFRLSFIQASTHLWWQSPWWGHGLGTFSEKIVPVFVQLIEAGNQLYEEGRYDDACQAYASALGCMRYYKSTDPDWRQKGFTDETLVEVNVAGACDTPARAERLRTLAPETAERIDPRNARRVIRALDLC